MKYRPGLPERNDNISEEGPLKEFATLLAGLFIIGAILYLILGLLIDFSVERISPETEQRWFKKPGLNLAIESTLGGAELEEHEQVALFESLKACAGIDVDLRLWKVESQVANALAVPGGEIIVFSGLEKLLETQNGLAFVLAHELAHFKHRDHLRGLGRGIVLTFLSSVIAGSDAALTRLVSPVSVLGQAGYSRSRERAADVLALDLLNCHYGHVGGATEFFERMAHRESVAYRSLHYFSTHPASQARISEMNALAHEKGYAAQKTIPLDRRENIHDLPK